MKNLVIIFALFISGCATPARYIQEPSFNDDNAATVYIYRTDVAYHSMNPEKPFFYIDDKLVAKLGTGSYTRFLVSPGQHSITSRESIVFAPGYESGNIAGKFEAGKTYYVRYSKEFSNAFLVNSTFVMSDNSSLTISTKENFDKRS